MRYISTGHIYLYVQWWMEAGVPGRMEPAVRPVVVEHREEPDPVTIQHQSMVERTVLDLVLPQDNVIQSPVQVICIVSISRINSKVSNATTNKWEGPALGARS